jgi:aminopeptidase N/puromycin-sensitive aminopeptidase
MAPDLQTTFTASERFSLVGDEWALVRAGTHTVADYMTIAAGFGHEESSTVFEEVSARLAFIHDYLTTTATREPFERFLQQLVGPAFDALGFTPAPGEDDDQRALRADLISFLGGPANDLNIGPTAQATLERVLLGDAELDPTAADAVVHVAARHGDAGLWDRFLAASKAATSPSEQYRYLYALPTFENRTLIDRGLNFALTPELRSQDTPQFLSRFLSNAAARDRAWTFIKAHWTELEPKITISLGDVYFANSLGSFCDAASRDDITAFFRAHKLPAASRTLDQTLERINNCIAIKDKQTASLTRWMSTAGAGQPLK